MKKMVVQSVRISKITAVFAVFLISFLLFPLFSSTNLKSLYAEDLVDGNTFTFISAASGTFSCTVISASEATASISTVTGYPDNVTIPSTVIDANSKSYSVIKLDNNCFQDCTFKSISIPVTVTTIGYNLFQDCGDLKSITVADGNTKFSSKDGVLYGITSNIKTTLLKCPQSTIETSIIIPDTVVTIEDKAFTSCRWFLESITIPSSVTSIGASTFYNCQKLATVTFKGATAPSFGGMSFFGVKSGAIANVPAGSTGTGTGKYDSTKYPFINDIPLKLTASISDSGGSSAPRALTPDEWVAQNHNIDQLANHYGPTPTGFLGMLYDNSMQRIPDTSGLDYWNEQLTNNVFGANQVAEHFLFSDEIGAKVAAMTNEDYVNYLYTTLLSRNSDADGYNNWLSYLNSGFSKEETLRAFLNNEEWINICKVFNVTP